LGWFTRAFRRGPARGARDPNASIRRALLAVLERDPAEAEAELTAAARAHPQDVDVFRALALLYRQQGEFARALQIRQSLLLRRDLRAQTRVEILGELAEDFRKAGMIRRAAAAYDEVLIHAPRNRRALVGLARLLRSLHEHGRALEITRRLARAEGRPAAEEEAALLVEQAEAAHAEGRSDDARRAARRARRRHRGHAPAHVLLGSLEAERGRNAAALAAWKEAVEVDPRTGAFVYPRLEAAFAAAGRTREFERFLRALLEKRPDDATARLALARALAAWGEVDAAMSELRIVLDRDGGSLPAQAALVRVLLQAGREREVLASLPALLERLEGDVAVVPRESSA
jgi:lipopolysaccharide biosynthesis regulator YciM